MAIDKANRAHKNVTKFSLADGKTMGLLREFEKGAYLEATFWPAHTSYRLDWATDVTAGEALEKMKAQGLPLTKGVVLLNHEPEEHDRWGEGNAHEVIEYV